MYIPYLGIAKKGRYKMTNRFSTGKRLIKPILSVAVALVLLITLFVNTAFADSAKKYDVTVIDGNDTIAVTTTETEPIEILKSAGITLSPSDKLDISQFVAEHGGTITIDRYNLIYLSLAGVITEYGVYSDTVLEALEELGYNVGENDSVSCSLSDPVVNGMVISIDSAITVTLTADGKSEDFALLSGNVQSLLDKAGVSLEGDDYTEPSLDTELTDGMSVTVNRVTYTEETVTETVKYDTVKIDDSDMEVGTEKVQTQGVNGEDSVTYKVKLVNGKEDSKTEISRKQTKKSVNKEVRVGTKLPDNYNSVEPNGVTTWNGYSVGDTVSGRYSHYCACSICNGNSRGVTTSGRRIQNGMQNPYYVACNWLPLGTVIDVDGQLYTVADRGGSGLSKKGRIDIFTPEGHSMCYALGVGNCTITIVRLGW